MLMIRQRGKKPTAVLILACLGWVVMDARATDIYEQIYYVLCLIAGIMAICAFVWFLDFTGEVASESHASVSDKSDNQRVWLNNQPKN